MNDHEKENFVTPSFISEAVCAGLLQKVNIEDIQTNQLGSFKKSYSNDIEKIEASDYANKTTFNIFINRNGIYDLLPEGLFHQTLGSGKTRSVKDAVSEHKRFKQEEKNARKFFAPVEQTLFRYRIYTELAENEALFDIQNGKLNRTFYSFWGIDQKLPRAEANRMLQMMPYCNFIKGNIEATIIALKFILNKEVTVSSDNRSNTVSLASPKAVKETRLGIDTVLGAEVKDVLQYWVFNINNLSSKELAGYVENGSINKLLKRFIEIFIPLEIDAEFEFSRNKEVEEDVAADILGYGSYL